MEVQQSPTDLVMVRPLKFGYDAESASSNAFQKLPKASEAERIAKIATKEFDAAVEAIRSQGVKVKVFAEDNRFETPDAVFPNNWFGTFPSGEVVLYPMMPEHRRLERRQDVVDHLREDYEVKRVLDLSKFELEGKYLEGTGSVVFDYPNRKAYACRSSRTNQEVLQELCREVGYQPVVFDSLDSSGVPVYHTNVAMWIGTDVAAVCVDSIPEGEEKNLVERRLAESGRTIVKLSHEEMNGFCGNALEIMNVSRTKRFLAISTSAAKALTPENAKTISRRLQMIVVGVDCLEQVGGGGIRCMLADIHLPKADPKAKPQQPAASFELQ